jgi:hypothetical protein
MLSFHQSETCEGIIQHLEMRERVRRRDVACLIVREPFGVTLDWWISIQHESMLIKSGRTLSATSSIMTSVRR